jgi:hypothetical protein
MTALPHPAKVSQKVPMISARYFLLFIASPKLFRFTDQPPDAPQLRRELAMITSACGLLRGGKFEPENSDTQCPLHVTRVSHTRHATPVRL